MLSPNLSKLTPWNLEANTSIFLGEMSVNPRTLYSITFSEIASTHKSPIVGVTLDAIRKEAKALNKFLKVTSYATSDKPLRPDLSDIEIALIHAVKDVVTDKELGELLNITPNRIKYIRSSTEHMYNTAKVPLPKLPLVTITDTSRYWRDQELLETYGLTSEDISLTGKPYKELLRRLEGQSQDLDFPINDTLCSKRYSEESIPRGTSIPSTLLKEDHEDYSNLSRLLWSTVSREEGLPNSLLSFNEEAYHSLTEGSPRLVEDSPKPPEGTPLSKGKPSGGLGTHGLHGSHTVDIIYSSAIRGNDVNKNTRAITHVHTKGGYNDPLKIPKNIIRLAVNIYNTYIKSNITTPNLEQLVINLLASPYYTSELTNLPITTLSSLRGHCAPLRNNPMSSEDSLLDKGKPSVSPRGGFNKPRKQSSNYLMDTPPLVYPKFAPKTYNYGVICHECSSFLSPNTISSCKHMILSTFQSLVSPNTPSKPLVYLYLTEETHNFSLYYYQIDQYNSITSVFTLDLLQFYTNFSLPLHRLPYE